MARFSSTIRHWQIGGEDDSSFEGLSDLNRNLAAHSQINRIGLNAEIGIPWQLERPLDGINQRTLGFVSLRQSKSFNFDELRAAFAAAKTASTARWVVPNPIQTSTILRNGPIAWFDRCSRPRSPAWKACSSTK
ncbi:MAG: hypothetical protein U0872_15060 [Planctomycetaceae bacterium]